MRARTLVAALVLATPGTAFAHSPIEGIGEFYAGILHPVFVLSHAMSLLVFALLVGQRGVRAMQFSYPPFMLALIGGLSLAGFELQPVLATETILLAIAMVCGLLVALHVRPPEAALAVLGVLLAMLIGMDSGVSGLNRQQTFAALCGCWLGAVLILIMVAGLAEMARWPWQRIAVRVLGSWTTASAALVLALALRPAL